MRVKLLEVRDRGTFMPVFAFDPTSPDNDAQRYLLRRSGFGDAPRLIMVGTLMGGSGQVACDPYDWTGARTVRAAHKFIEENWDALTDGDVVCVEHILGERETPKISERLSP